MADIETLGTAPGAVILSIGAVKFNKEGVYGEPFYMVIDPKSCVDVGLRIDIDTVMWWLDQSQEAQRALTQAQREYLPAVLLDFGNWVHDEHMGHPDAVEVWGNGANFDNVLLKAAYDACGLPPPWKFFNDRCYRTVKSMHPDMPMVKRTGTHHNALDDARSQAEHLITLPSFQAMCAKEEEVGA